MRCSLKRVALLHLLLFTGLHVGLITSEFLQEGALYFPHRTVIVSMDITAAIFLQTVLTKGRHHCPHIMCLRWHQPADDDAGAR